jgi:CDP-glucose 4,6-dehydratase
MVTREFWRGQSVFVTGHTGFKGGWLTTWLTDMGARVSGYALSPHTQPSYFLRCGLPDRVTTHIADVRDATALQAALAAARPRIVFHLAAQPIVLVSYRAPLETIAVNVMGTANLLEGVRHTPSVEAVVVITSDKCYENREREEGYREDEALGGHDPYSASKAAAELVADAYRRSFFATTGPKIATVRAGNVIGGGDWAEARLVPDAVRALVRGETIRVRNPAAIRPWQHALEPLRGYLALAERLCTGGREWAGPWNFGPRDEDTVPVSTLVGLIAGAWEGGRWEAKPEGDAPHEATLLRLDWTKARTRLGWQPVLSIKETVEMTVAWYRAAAATGDRSMYDASVEQIRDYEKRWRLTQEP